MAGDRVRPEEVEKEGSGDETRSALSLEAFQKPETIDRAAVSQASDAIYKACKGWGTDEDAIYKALGGKNPSELEALKQDYRERYGMTLDAQLRDELSGSELDTALELSNKRPGKDYKEVVNLRHTFRVLDDLGASSAMGALDIYNGVAGGRPAQAGAGASAVVSSDNASSHLEGQMKQLADEMSGKDVQRLSAEYRRVYGEDLMQDARKYVSSSTRAYLKDRGWNIPN